MDKLPLGLPRFWDYALFSDAAAACLVTSRPGPGAFRFLGSADDLNLNQVLGGVRFDGSSPMHLGARQK